MIADGRGDEVRDGVHIVDAGACASRLQRMTQGVWRVYRCARALKGQLYQLHDPELLPVGLLLKRQGACVVFDAHEDVQLQLLAKPYLARPLRGLLASVYARLQAFAARRFDGIVAATPTIAARFTPLNAETVCVCNYPLLAEFAAPTPWDARSGDVCYLGDLSRIRGACEMVRAIGLAQGTARLQLAGPAPDGALLAQLQAEPGWQRVQALGQLERGAVQQLLARCRAGLVTLHPTANYLDSLPIKMFEYMAAGIPVIASDFPAWRTLVEAWRCGVLVDPLDPAAIARAIDELGADAPRAQAMGERGRQAVLTHLHWEHECQHLLALYARLLARAVPAPARPSGRDPVSPLLARWHRYRALLLALWRMPSERLQFQRHLNPDDVLATYHNFTRPHPRYRLFRHKSIGVALVDLRRYPDPAAYLTHIGGRNMGAELALRARKRGYRVVQIDRDGYADQIHAINISLPERQGRPMEERYRRHQRHFEALPNHRYYGVLGADGQLAAYATVGMYGDFAALGQLLGYRNNHGAMHLLVADMVSTLIAEQRARFLMYDTFFGASDGLQRFKRMLGFQPYRVSYDFVE